MKTMLEEWIDFRDGVAHPEKRGPNEVENMRRCFYCGGLAVLSLLESVDLEREGGIKQVLALMAEMKDFMKDLHNYDERTATTPVRKEF